MQRYFVKSVTEVSFTITSDDAKHISRVMRMNSGDKIICVSEQEHEAFLCQLLTVDIEKVEVKVLEKVKVETELPVHVTVAQSLPKGDKLDYIVQKGTELGASHFIPLQSKRAIVKWEAKKVKKKLERLQKIAKEAAEQSYRLVIPQIADPINWNELIERVQEYDLVIVAYEEQAKSGEQAELAKALNQLEDGNHILVVIGPEGGLDSEEVQALHNKGAKVCGLGPRILRTETASLYMLAAISYQFELLR
ncbi:16S rRNA methyltransferase [Alkalihalobacillus pseudalcaliphilus]|nr:16S rRNA (uracil(1498)-N(3))-methyltransferase [Alkalihalobacillus pseudalcaliphilus]KMK75943.1 16S rRNA methyltransferase [Alkalihalobacillus pseudalcaliphilus]